jgi:anti-anti-sigma factor
LAADFEVRDRTHGETRILTLTGELDLGSGAVLADAIARACAAGSPRLILDIRELEFIDSTGLREIVAGKARCEEHSCRFLITEGRPRVERVFEIAGLLDLLAPYRTEVEATDEQLSDTVEK